MQLFSNMFCLFFFALVFIQVVGRFGFKLLKIRGLMMIAASASSGNDSRKYFTKMAAMDWALMARKHPSRSTPGQIDEAKLERIYRKMDAALQEYFNGPGRAGSDSLDSLSMQALFNFGRACHFTTTVERSARVFPYL